MQGRREGDFETAAGDAPAGIAGIDVFRALPVQVHADLEIADDLRAGLFRYLRRVADVVVMPVRQHDVGDASGDLVDLAVEFRIAAEERVDQQGRVRQVDTKGRMAEPGNFHELPTFMSAPRQGGIVAKFKAFASAAATAFGRAAPLASPACPC